MAKSKGTKKEAKPNWETYGLPEPSKSLFREIFEVLLFGLVILIFFKSYIGQNFQIPTASMENTLLIGDHITANTMIFKGHSPLDRSIFPFRDIKRGDVVVFKWPKDVSQDWIKRCVGIPGDQFKIVDNRLFINNEPLQEEYPYYKKIIGGTTRDPNNRYRPMDYDTLKPGIDHADYLSSGESFDIPLLKQRTKQSLRGFQKLDQKTYDHVIERLESSDPEIIPPGFYLMMGDNRNNSMDSRTWGLVPFELVHGRAYLVWWSYGEDENSHELRNFDLLWSYLRVPFTLWTRTHWEKTFSLIK